MKYISEEYVPADWIKLAEENNKVINIRFCRECEYFMRSFKYSIDGMCQKNGLITAENHICYEDYINEILQ